MRKKLTPRELARRKRQSRKALKLDEKEAEQDMKYRRLMFLASGTSSNQKSFID